MQTNGVTLADPAGGAPPLPRETFWLAIPEVQVRYALRATGKPNLGWHTHCLSFVPPERRAQARMLVLGSDTGWLVDDLAGREAFGTCTVLDPSREAVERARAASVPGRSAISYEHADLSNLAISENAYDAVWCNMVLGGAADVARLTAQIARSLRPTGFLFANEYVGANGYQLSRRNREAIRAAFALVPPRYRRRYGRPELEPLAEPQLPTPESAIAAGSPVNSVSVVPAISEHFDMMQYRAIGGTLLQYVLAGIAGNFKAGDRASMIFLRMLFDIEDALVDTGELGSDFALVVARPKPR